MKAIYGVLEVDRIRSRGVAKIVIEVPLEGYKDYVAEFDGSHVLITCCDEMDQPFGIVESEEQEPSEFITGELDREPEQIAIKTTDRDSVQAAFMCKSPEFWRYLATFDGAVVDEKTATDYFRRWCQIESRAELDSNGEAKRFFIGIRDDFRKWVNRGEAA